TGTRETRPPMEMATPTCSAGSTAASQCSPRRGQAPALRRGRVEGGSSDSSSVPTPGTVPGPCYAPAMGRVASATFVGRAAELAVLDDAFETAAAGRTTTVLIGADAGVGKSRLLSAWNERARDRGATVAVGWCLDVGDSGPAYAAVVQALRQLFETLDPAAVDVMIGADRSALARILPELAAGEGDGADDGPSL